MKYFLETVLSRDHNATSYSTETLIRQPNTLGGVAEIITLRAIALKRIFPLKSPVSSGRRDHNATSYSTETLIEPVAYGSKTTRQRS